MPAPAVAVPPAGPPQVCRPALRSSGPSVAPCRIPRQQPQAQGAATRGPAARRRRAPPAAWAAAPDAGQGGYDSDTDGQTVEQRLRLVQNMVATSELLIPYDRSAVNLGLILWGAIRNIPPKERVQLVSRLTSAQITKLWKIAGQRYTAPAQQVAAAVGPDYSVWKDMPAAAGQLSRFRGKAALPTHVLGLSSFSKAFFLPPESQQLYGRVLLGKGPLGDLLYPLYFRAAVGPAVVPNTQELCDVVLQYQPPEQLALDRTDLPRTLWPSPRPHLPPFHEGFTDYLRAAGPGVYVGLGYRTATTEPSVPLFFLMAHQGTE